MPLARADGESGEALAAYRGPERLRLDGEHLYIDYVVALDPDGRIRSVEILQYRESYGGEIRSPGWLAQFAGKSSTSALQVGNDIRNISGATLSSHHVTEGVKRILAYYASHLR